MLLPRIIPCLLLKDQGLVKTIKFKNETYIGDPLNAIRIFNQKEVDELVIFDIDSTVEKKAINLNLLEKIASECFMPVTYGGGVKTIEDFKSLFNLGVEKVSVSSLLFDNPNIIKEAISIFGSQSVISTIDVYKPLFKESYSIKTHSGTLKRKIKALEAINIAHEVGVGEIIVNNINLDGTWRGFDIDLLKKIVERSSVPIVALGGAGSLNDIKEVLKHSFVSAVGIGSMAVFQSKGMGVLIKYPRLEEIEKIIKAL